jgi:hypothetical protein
MFCTLYPCYASLRTIEDTLLATSQVQAKSKKAELLGSKNQIPLGPLPNKGQLNGTRFC